MQGTSVTKTISEARKGTKGAIQLSRLSEEKVNILKRYVRYLEGKRLSASTVNVYSNFIHEFVLFHNSRPPNELNENDVRTYLEWAAKELKIFQGQILII